MDAHVPGRLPFDRLVDRQPMQLDRVHCFKFDGEIAPRKEEFVLERFEIGQQRQAGRHGLPRTMIVRLAVADMEAALLAQKTARDLENEEHNPGVRWWDLDRGSGTIRQRDKIPGREVEGADVQF